MPTEAIYPDDELPEQWAHYAAWNAYRAEQWRDMGRNLTEKKEALPEAEAWAQRQKSEQDILTWNVEPL